MTSKNKLAPAQYIVKNFTNGDKKLISGPEGFYYDANINRIVLLTNKVKKNFMNIKTFEETHLFQYTMEGTTSEEEHYVYNDMAVVYSDGIFYLGERGEDETL